MSTVKSFPGGLKYDWDGLANVPEVLKNTPVGADVGHILEVTKVDDEGKILEVKAVDFPEADLTGYATEDYVTKNTNRHYLTPPIYREEQTELMHTTYINVRDLADSVFYGPDMQRIKKILDSGVKYIATKLVFVCDDKTECSIANALDTLGYDPFYIRDAPNQHRMNLNFCAGERANSLYSIDYGNMATATDVSVTIARNLKYLGVSNTSEFTPAYPYAPATKKYVDDAVAALGNGGELTALSSLITEKVSETTAKADLYGVLSYKYQAINIYNDTGYNMVSFLYNGSTIGAFSKNTLAGIHVSKYTDNDNLTFQVYSLNGTNREVVVTNGALSTSTTSFVKLTEVLVRGNNVEYTPTTDYSPATKKYVDDAVADSSQNVDLTGYAKETWVQEGFQPKGDYLTEVPSGYATEEYVKNKIAEAELGGEEVDLSGYAQKSEIPTKVSQLANDSGYLTEHQDLSEYAKKTEIPSVPVQSVNGKTGAVSLSASDVGADPAGTAESKVSAHNTDIASHNDLRLELKALSDRLTTFFDSDDTTLDELSEIVAYITSNKTLIESITTSKVSVADIVDNLTTNVSNKPLSAAQGVALKSLIDAVSNSLSGYQPKGNYALASQIPTVPTEVSAFTNDAGYLTQHQDISGLAVKFDPTVYGLPVLYLTGDTAPIAVSKDNKVTLDYTYGDRSGTCTLKGQGATSYKTAQALANAGKAGKFNYTINFDAAFEAKEGWGVQKKYCLKANFIDHTHSRNICSCKLWGMSVKSRSVVPAELADLPNGGAIDGFPIVIILNGEFHGLYTWNIPKDGWMFGLVEDATETQAIVGADDHTAATQFKEASMSGFEVEFASDEDNMDWVETSLTRLISAVMNSDGSDLDTTIAQYLDWDSAIDHYIHTVVDKATDCVDKNYLLVTYDGVKWYMSVYDRDSIHGLNWDASGTTRPVSNCSFLECAETVRVYELIKRFKTNALKARYKELRGNILSESRIMQTFENFAWAIPSPVMLEDVKLYPTILGSGVNTIDQIGRFVRQRLETVDAWVDALPAQEIPSGGSTVTTHAVTNKLTNCASSNGASAVNAGAAYSATITASDGYTLDGATVTVTMGGMDITSTAYSNGAISISSVTGALVITIAAVKKASGYTNLVPTSTDTDGSIYNGTGYNDNVRLSSSGGLSSSPQTGSVVTGFIPCTNEDVLRIKGAEWIGMSDEHAGHHYYVNFYNSDKTLKQELSSQAYGSGVWGTGITYDETTGVTTFVFKNTTLYTNSLAKGATFIRLNAYGKGSDLIVTVNEEIT